MMQFWVLYKKEMLESMRNKKWIWLPLIFVLLAAMDPVINYFLPEILDAVGELPEGAILQFPDFSSTDAVMMSLGQLGTLGVLIIALSSMGTIAGERKSGLIEMILAKPVNFHTYVLSKWIALLTMVWVAYLLGMLGAWYYIGLLYNFIPTSSFLLLTFFYGIWLTFVASVSIFYNTISKSPGIVAFLTIATIGLMSVITSLFGTILSWSPNQIANHIQTMLLTEEIPTELYGASILSLFLSGLLILVGIGIFRNKEHGA